MRAIVTALAGAALLTGQLPAGQTAAQPAAVLAAARAALGGDAALDAVTAFRVSGTETDRIGGMNVSRSLTIHVQLPDRFLQTTRSTFNDPFGGGFTMTRHAGFNGDLDLSAVSAPGAPMPVVIPAPPPRSPQEAQARADRARLLTRLDFARLMLPLFAAAPAAFPLQFTSGGRVSVDGRDADAVIAMAPGAPAITLFIDAATHLPIRMTWMAEPIVTMTTSRTVVTDSRGAVRSESPLTPSAPPPPPSHQVEWSTVIEDYKPENGLTWPRRFKTFVEGREVREVRLGKYAVNPKIDPKTFDVRK